MTTRKEVIALTAQIERLTRKLVKVGIRCDVMGMPEFAVYQALESLATAAVRNADPEKP